AVLDGTASLAFWINTTQTGNALVTRAPGVTGVTESNDGSNDLYWGWLNNSGQIALTADGGTAQSSAAINDGTWHHVVLTRDADTGALQVYIDGALNATGASTPGVKT